MSESHPLNSLSSRDRGSDLVLPDESRSGRERFMWGAVLVLLTLIAYSPLLKARFIWDDDRYVTHNRMLRDAEGLKRIWTEKGATPQYYPLVHTMFWVEYHLWGVNPIGYHLVNVILHAAGGVMLWLALRRLRVPGAWLAAAIFLLHPIQVESVAWVTERKNVLAGLLFFSSIWAYLRFARIELDENKPAWGWYLPSLALFAGALFSKTIACSMPAVMVLILWWKRKLSWKQIVALLPFFAIGLFMALGTAAMERNIVGAGGEEWALTPMQRILIAGRATCFYAGKLIWPVHLTFIYPRWWVDPAQIWQFAFPGAVLGAIAGLGILAWWWRGPLVAVIYFLGTLTPALGFFDVYPMRYSFVADHFQYLSGIGLVVLIVALIGRCWPKQARRTAMGLGGALLLILGVLTWRQTHVYADVQTLWRDTLAKNPAAWIASYNLGLELLDESSALAAEARSIHANDPERAGEFNSESRRMLGEALDLFRQTVRNKPDHARAHAAIGEVLRQQGDLRGALAELNESIRLNPDGMEAYNMRGVVELAMDRPRDAIADFRRAIEAYEKAIRQIESRGQRYALNPKSRPDVLYRMNLGKALANEGELEEAAEVYSRIIEIRPEDAAAYFERGKACGRLGSVKQALADFLKVTQLRPDDPDGYTFLGWALLDAGQGGLAEPVFIRALQLNANNPKAKEGLKRARELLAVESLFKAATNRPTTQAGQP
jgi:tetratricopeptide (TPR) repeat protein